jgi:hypothetical protein
MYVRQLMVKINNNKRQIIYTCLYLVTIIMGTICIHEAGHAIAAIVLGVPVKEIKIGFDGINPSVMIQAGFTNISLTSQYYAGGFSAAFVLLLVYAYWFRKYYCTPSVFSWIAGIITIGVFGMQIAQGYIEGRFHALYIVEANSIIGAKDIFIYLTVGLACSIHLVVCPTSKYKKAQTESSAAQK